jgi:hypothetical protein
MNRNGDRSHPRRVVDYAAAATEEMKNYCTNNPRSPCAERNPQLFIRGDLWIAQFGPSVEEGIVGIGPTVAAALRAFDAQYLISIEPPNEGISAPVEPPYRAAAPAADA